jgi:hypothetical protein
MLKIPLILAFDPDRVRKAPVLGRFEPDLWSLSAQSSLSQYAVVFSEGGQRRRVRLRW